MSRMLSALTMLMGCGLIAIAAYGWVLALEPSGVVIEEPDRALSNIFCGEEIERSVLIRNSGQHAVRVVGLSEC